MNLFRNVKPYFKILFVNRFYNFISLNRSLGIYNFLHKNMLSKNKSCQMVKGI